MINLLNESDLNKYLTNIVYGSEEVPHWVKDNTSQSQENLRNRNWVQENKDDIARAILLQYFKKRVREYMKNTASYFTPVNKGEQNLPEWAKNALSDGKEIYHFDEEKVSANFKEEIATVRDYLYSMADDYIYKSLKNQDDLRIKLDFLKSHNDYLSFENALDFAKLWHARLAERSAKVRKDDKFYQKSLEGTEFVMELSNGMKVYKLLTLEALDFEGDNMGHCVGIGYYDKALENGSKEFYSIRDNNGEPHVTFEIKGNKMLQCKGKQNKRPIKKHIYSAREFIKRQRYDIQNDLNKLDLIQLTDNHGKTKIYDIYEIPNGTYKDFDISNRDLTTLTIFDFNNIIIERDFNCSNNKLTSLEGAPKVIHGTFSCSNNQLTSLKGGPEIIEEILYCDENKLTSLNGLPKVLNGTLKCESNNLTTLEGCPEIIKGDFDCSDNPLTTLKGGPKVVDGNYKCSNDGLISLAGSPEEVKGSFDCSNNQLTSLNGSPEEVKGSFDCSNNQLTSLNGSPEIVNDYFDCHNNQLVTLKGGPRIVNGSYNCSDNKLTTLKDGPEFVEENFSSLGNPIIDYDYMPKTVEISR